MALPDAVTPLTFPRLAAIPGPVDFADLIVCDSWQSEQFTIELEDAPFDFLGRAEVKVSELCRETFWRSVAIVGAAFESASAALLVSWLCVLIVPRRPAINAAGDALGLAGIPEPWQTLHVSVTVACVSSNAPLGAL